MNKEKWENYTLALTGEAGVIINPDPKDNSNHLGIALEFFKESNVDSDSKSFLDLGAGNNSLRNQIKSIWCGADMFSEAAGIIRCDMHELPLNEKSFDIVFCSHTLEHVLSPIVCISEIERVLKDEGDAFISVPIYPGFISNGHNYVMVEGSWEHLFHRCGFKVIRKSLKENCGNFHLRKK